MLWSDIVDLFSNCRYLPVFSVQGHKRVSSTYEWMSSRLTFPKLQIWQIWQKTICNMSFGTESLTFAVRYVTNNLAIAQSNVKSPGIPTAFFPACEMELSFFLLSHLSPIFPTPIQFWGWKFWDQPLITFRLTLSKHSTFLCCLILRHCRI